MRKSLLVLPCLMFLSLRAVADAPSAMLSSPPDGSVADVPAADGTPTVKIDFSNTPVADVLAYYGTLTGQQVVYENSVVGQVTLQSSQPVTKERAEAMIEEALFLNGFTLVDNEDGTILRVIGLGKPPRAFGVPVFVSAADFPKHERVVSLVINLRFADAQKTGGLLEAYCPPNAVTAFTPVGSHTLVLTGPTNLLRRLLKVVEVMDVEEVSTTTKSLSLKPTAVVRW